MILANLLARRFLGNLYRLHSALADPHVTALIASLEFSIEPEFHPQALALHPRLHILYKAEIDQIPILARAFRMGGFIPVDRRNKEAAMRSIEAGARSIRSGNSFLIFPEGTRSKTGDLLPFKKGGFIMAIKAQAPIVPVAITGGRAAMKRGSPWIYPVRVTIKVGQPIETAGVPLDERDELIDRVRTEIAHLLRSLHETSGHAVQT